MSVLGGLATFAIGAAAGAAGGVIGARLLAPTSGQDTQQAFQALKDEITTAGEMAKAQAEWDLQQQYRATVAARASARAAS